MKYLLVEKQNHLKGVSNVSGKDDLRNTSGWGLHDVHSPLLFFSIRDDHSGKDPLLQEIVKNR